MGDDFQLQDFTGLVVCWDENDDVCFEGWVSGDEYVVGPHRTWQWTCPTCGEYYDDTDPDD